MKEFSITALQEALKQHDKIAFALLFGSSKNGTLIKEGADVDIALYLTDAPSADMLAEIVGLCQDAIQYDAIDLVVLNDADPILSFEALSGKLLFCNNEEAYLSFYSLTCRQYEDEIRRIERSRSYRRSYQG